MKTREKYILTENAINGIKLNEKIRDYEFSIIDREDFIDELINLISEATTDRQLMKEDLKELMNWDDLYILSSNSTNSYLGKHSAEFEQTCKELLELNSKL